jgi:hypothetical protein
MESRRAVEYVARVVGTAERSVSHFVLEYVLPFRPESSLAHFDIQIRTLPKYRGAVWAGETPAAFRGPLARPGRHSAPNVKRGAKPICRGFALAVTVSAYAALTMAIGSGARTRTSAFAALAVAGWAFC